MGVWRRLGLSAVVLWLTFPGARSLAQVASDGGVETRAVAYLSAEVPKWRREHPCYSCHNNGDAARALIAAAARGHQVDAALADTRDWLANPSRWSSNARRGGSEELPLARIQFSSALADMVAGGSAPRAELDQAAALVAADQRPDGSWRLSDTQTLGGATFYGTSLATAMARRTLARAGSAAAASTARADRWLREAATESVHDAAAIVLGLARASDSAASAQRAKAIAVIRRGQGQDGGWGPYVNSSSEPFDTALVVLALVEARAAAAPYSTEEAAEAISGGRRYLRDTQLPDGSWEETTRPAGDESYAQRISTTAWALLALFASR